MKLINYNDENHRALMLRLGYQIDPGTFEQWLWLGVVGQAVFDAFVSTAESPGEVDARHDARKFLSGPRLDQLLIAIGLDPEWTRAQIEAFRPHAEQNRLNRMRRMKTRLVTRQFSRNDRRGQKDLFGVPIMTELKGALLCR